MDGIDGGAETLSYGTTRWVEFFTEFYAALTPELRAELHELHAELERIEREGDDDPPDESAGERVVGESTRARPRLVGEPHEASAFAGRSSALAPAALVRRSAADL